MRIFKPRDGSVFRFLFGRRLKTDEARTQRVGALQGVPILGLDAIGSSSYGPEAALAVMIPLGAVGFIFLREVVLAILLLLAILYFSYRQIIAAYPEGGGSYAAARSNLGQTAGLWAAAALLLDYVLNVAVGISAGVGALVSAAPALQDHTLACCLALLVIITLVNLRGVRDSGLAWALPAYLYVGGMFLVLAIGVGKVWQSGGHPTPVEVPPPLAAAPAPVGAWLILRAFASGCTAMTGVEAVSNGVPIFSEPAVRTARRTLALICGILAVLLLGVGFLAGAYHIGARHQGEADYQSIVSQLVAAVTGRGFLYYVVIGGLLGVLALSANTSFASFPRLCRLLAEDSFLPSAFANLGRRLVYTWGILILALTSALLLIAFGGITDRLIPLFAVGAFSAFTFAQAGMVVHWRRQGKSLSSPSLLINALGATVTSVALLVITTAKFPEGAWITVLVVPGLVIVFKAVHRHYQWVGAEIEPPSQLQTSKVEPLKVILPINGWNRVTERALRFALRISDDVVAVHVTTEPGDAALIKTWRRCIEGPASEAGLPRPRLEVIVSPYRLLMQPLLDFVEAARQESPDRLVAIVIPELVQPRWWEYLLHNHFAAGLKALLFLRGDERVIVINTPWRLGDHSSRNAP